MSCEACNSGCESKNSCQSCDSCQKCDSGCQKGDKCTGCNTSEAFCESKQTVGSFSWDASCSHNSPLFSKSTYGKIITFINSAYGKGTKKNYGTSNAYTPSGSFYTAESFNSIVNALNGLGGCSGVPRKVSPKDFVYGSYFSSLASAASTLKYKKDQCDKCNTDCDVTCDTCESCDKGCEKCNNGNCGSCNSGCQSNSSKCCDSPPPSCTSGQ